VFFIEDGISDRTAPRLAHFTWRVLSHDQKKRIQLAVLNRFGIKLMSIRAHNPSKPPLPQRAHQSRRCGMNDGELWEGRGLILSFRFLSFAFIYLASMFFQRSRSELCQTVLERTRRDAIHLLWSDARFALSL